MGVFFRRFEDFKPILEQHKWRRDSIVTLNGCFDIIHAAHIRLLHESSELGDVFIVGLNSDESIERIKGYPKPYLGINQRSKTICSFPCVDYVLTFDEDTPCEWLKKIRPDVHVNDASYGVNCVEAPILEAFGGRLHLVEQYPDLSSTDIAQIVLDKNKQNE